MPRKSLLGPTLFTLFGLVLLLGLGTWQLQRLTWKEGLIAERQAAMTGTPVPLPTTRAAAQRLAFHRVRADGRLLNERELYLHAISAAGEAGYHVVTPMMRADGTAVLIDRGFVPEDRKAPSSRAGGDQEGATSVTGVLRFPEPHGWFVPDNRPAQNEWFFIDLPAMAKAAHLATVLPFYVEADATPNPGGFPIGGQTQIDLPNHHLQYALTWYALAVALVVFYILLVRRRREDRS